MSTRRVAIWVSMIVAWPLTIASVQSAATPVPNIIPVRLPASEPAPEPPVAAGRSLSLADLESMALGNNPTLQQAAGRVESARGRQVQSGLSPNPEVGYSGDEIGQDGKAGQQGGFVSQKFITAKKLQLSQSAAAHEVVQAQHAYCAQRLRVLSDVRAGYYELLVARRAVELQKQMVEIGRAGLKTAEALLNAKEVSRIDTLQAKIELESASLELNSAQNRYTAAARQLAAVVGCGDTDMLAVAEPAEWTVPLWTWPETFTRLRCESPEMAEAHAGVQRARWELQRENAGRVPDLTAEASLKYDNATQNTIAGVQVGVPVPLFDRNQGNIQRAYGELVTAENEVRRVELSLQQRLAAAFERYETARQQAEKYKESVLPSAKESLDLVTAGYRAGEFPYVDLLTAQRTYFRVNLAYLESLRALQTSHVALEGLLLSGGLEARGR